MQTRPGLAQILSSSYYVVTFDVVSVDPVDDVEGSVWAKCEQVMGSDGLGLARLRHHEQLENKQHYEKYINWKAKGQYAWVSK